MTGTARVGRRTTTLVKRLRPGDIALIDHLDLDKVSADALVAARVAAVVNMSASTSGRYPNLGPQVLIDAGVPLLDVDDTELMNRVSDGELVAVDGANLRRGDQTLATGRLLDAGSVTHAMREARSGMSTQLEAFTANAQEFIRRERDLLLDGEGVPEVRTKMQGRHVVVVLQTHDVKRDLRRVRTYLKEKRPVLVAAGGGADALLAAGHRPDLIVGDGDSLSEKALGSGAEVVLHHARGARPVGEDRLDRLGVRSVPFATSGTIEDAAMLLAASHGAQLVVAVGGHTDLVEFLDKGRSTMASNFITRLRLGPQLVDAASVQHLYRPRVRTWQVQLLAVVALVAVGLAVAGTPVGQPWWQDLQEQITLWWDQLRGTSS